MAATVCSCAERLAAVRDEWFLYVPSHGWFFTDGPTRSMSVRAAYFACERGIENHTGEPFYWTDCPFCGVELPSVAFDAVWGDEVPE
jgi:hypothetical protein